MISTNLPDLESTRWASRSSSPNSTPYPRPHLPIFSLCMFAAAVISALAVMPLRADELNLKDGKKLSGTIVGFENGMFRLKTEYGYILVQKDKVSSIKVTESASKEVLPNYEASEAGHAATAIPSETVGANSPSDTGRAALPQPPKPPSASKILNVPLPAHIEQHEEGNNYVNDTFHFSMFKPPGWKIYGENLPEGKISAIVALASEDERTLLFVDRQVWSGVPDLKNDGVEANIRSAYQDYKKLSESEAEVSGFPAIRHEFSGVMDGAEWHGFALRVAQAHTLFGILGMTSSETIDFQEAVLNKMVKSFKFLSSSDSASAAHGASTP